MTNESTNLWSFNRLVRMITYITYSYIILSLKLSVVYVCYVCV